MSSPKNSRVVLSVAMPDGTKQPDPAGRRHDPAGQFGEEHVGVHVPFAGQGKIARSCAT